MSSCFFQLLRWAISPPAMWKRRTDFTQRTTSVRRPFKADRLQRAPRPARCSFLRKPQNLWSGSGSAPPPFPHKKNPKQLDSRPPTSSRTEQMSARMFPERHAISCPSAASSALPRGRFGKHSAQKSPRHHLSSCLLLRSSRIAAEDVVPRCRTYIDGRGASVPGRSRCCWRTRLWPFLEKSTETKHTFWNCCWDSCLIFSHFQPFNWCMWYLNVTTENGPEPFERRDPPPHSLNQALFVCWWEVLKLYLFLCNVNSVMGISRLFHPFKCFHLHFQDFWKMHPLTLFACVRWEGTIAIVLALLLYLVIFRRFVPSFLSCQLLHKQNR